MVCLETNWDHFVIFETTSKYCISDSSVVYEGYSISSKGFLPTVVDVMVSWIKLAILIHFSSLIPKILMFTLATCSLSCLTVSRLPWFMDLTFQNPIQHYSLQHWTSLPDISTTDHHFRFGPASSFFSGAISNFPLLFPNSILDTFWPEGLIFKCHIFMPFQSVHGVLRATILKWFAFPPLVDHTLSELSTMTCLSWVALEGMAHSFIELCKPLNHDKAVIHEGVIMMVWSLT